jgi:hypothetical protein
MNDLIAELRARKPHRYGYAYGELMHDYLITEREMEAILNALRYPKEYLRNMAEFARLKGSEDELFSDFYLFMDKPHQFLLDALERGRRAEERLSKLLPQSFIDALEEPTSPPPSEPQSE